MSLHLQQQSAVQHLLLMHTTTVTLTTSAAHNISVGDIIRLTGTTLPGGTTGVTYSYFDDTNFQVLSVPTSTTLTIKQQLQDQHLLVDQLTINPFEVVGPAAQSYGYGYGVGNYGGTITGAAQSTLNGAFLQIQMVQVERVQQLTLASIQVFQQWWNNCSR